MIRLDNSKEIFEEFKKYLFVATPYIEPIITHGEGVYVWDEDGNRYLDLNSGQFCVAFGHNYKPMNSMINKQIEKIYHTNTMTLTKEVLQAAKDVAEIHSGSLNKTIFLSTGAEANECALRYAKFISGKNCVVSLDKGYHGLTLATQSLTMSGAWARPKVEGMLSVKTPDILYRDPSTTEKEHIEECVQDLKRVLEQHKEDIAAFILEPMLGVGGMIILPVEYVKAVRELCTEYNIILILDECQTGFGRTGEWFAYQYYGIIPDMVVTAKAMGLGFPVAAVTFREELASLIEGKITHFSSHQNDPLPAAITSFVINTVREQGILQESHEKGNYFLERLSELSGKCILIKNVRGIGLMLAFDLPIELMGEQRELSGKLINELLSRGVMIQAIRQGLTFRILPSYMILKEDIDLFIDALEASVKKVEEGIIK